MSVIGKTLGATQDDLEETVAGDFLKKTARTPLSAVFLAAGVHLRIETNSESILAIAGNLFESPVSPYNNEEIRLKLWVEPGRDNDGPLPNPYFRGLRDLVFCGFDERNSLLLRLSDRSGNGRFTPAVAADAKFWKTIFFPSLLTIVGPSVGLTPLHCACVSWKGSGLLLAGQSGAGKSTLSLALAQAGFDYLSDDRTLIGDRHGRVLAWGLTTDMKHGTGAAEHFAAMRDMAPSGIWKGAPVFRFDPVELAGVRRVPSCEPRWVVFLDRQPDPGFFFDPVARDDAIHRLERDVHRQTPDVAARQSRTISALCEAECFNLRYGGSPHTIAGALRCFVDGKWNGGKRNSSAATFHPPGVEFAPADPLKRFRATPFHAELRVMSKRIRLETDSPLVLKFATEAFAEASTAGDSPPFVWRILSEPHQEPEPRWPPITAFGDRTCRYINIGQRSFIAVDLEAREGAGIVPEHLAENEAGFVGVFLSTMFYVTAPALGLMTLSAASVALDDRCLLLFGPPNSGKTTSSYWAKRLGMTFHADQAAFLEIQNGAVRVWGDFWPAAFRPETAAFLPELKELTRPYHYRDRSFLCVDKCSAQQPARSVKPAACIFLERGGEATPRLIPITGRDAKSSDLLTLPFKDDAGPGEQREKILDALHRLPWYRLPYGDDPYVAAVFYRSILNTHRPPEVPL